ncbi:3315_t:CDS:2 [Gigaspora margarita]|uniref:3315_t:CDS:1 n=1 Tax=Gigaspora margarita TaxID=4874 RepID=A0ABN7UIW2_GIGMA|nr:3315_t:CDS:2 [Gigaspora margarita]
MKVLSLHDLFDGRFGHSSILIDSKLYVSGGFKFIDDGRLNLTNEFFYLDVSKSFTTTDPNSMPWTDLTFTGGPDKNLATACSGNNNSIFIIGGNGVLNSQPPPFVNQFDINKQQWADVPFNGCGLNNRVAVSCTGFNNGLISIFGGCTNTSGTVEFVNDLWVFNTLKSAWGISIAINAPLPRCNYRAITLPDGNILYIGGNNSTSLMPMDNLPLYNTTSIAWISVTTSGATPPGRQRFSAVLIFGGIDYESTFLGDLWILDINTFQWSAGQISNPIADLNISGHTATLVNNYMFVTFGLFNNESASATIYMLDVSQKDSYAWVTEFTPNATNLM